MTVAYIVEYGGVFDALICDPLDLRRKVRALYGVDIARSEAVTTWRKAAVGIFRDTHGPTMLETIVPDADAPAEVMSMLVAIDRIQALARTAAEALVGERLSWAARLFGDELNAEIHRLGS